MSDLQLSLKCKGARVILNNLNIDEVIYHRVHQRLLDKKLIAPTYGTTVFSLSGDGLDVFRDRIIGALGTDAKSVTMQIDSYDEGSALALARKVSTAGSKDEFALHTRALANKLANDQDQPNWPGGLLVVFRGSAGVPSRKVVGIIKAETDGGFQPVEVGLEYLKNLFMTRESKLYKIGFFWNGGDDNDELPGGWVSHVYDSHMTMANRDAAAHYFYGRFLGCSLPLNAARLTKSFYHAARRFINETGLSDEDKSDLFTSLYTYMKVDNTPTIHTATFASQYLPDRVRDAFSNYMKENDFPENAVPKDISEIQGVLKKRKVKFPGDILLTAPPDVYQRMVEVSTIDGDEINGKPQAWTKIVIKDRVREIE